MSDRAEDPTEPKDENYEDHYILNDALSPSPQSGPRVMVGFWANDQVAEGDRPELTSEPFFTITYPVDRGEACYNWYHFTDDPEEEPHPNSANNIEWQNGHLKIVQSTEFGCRPNLNNITNLPKEKCMFWEVFQDFPTYLWGRIMATYEITDIVIRERCVLQFRAGDGHFIGLSDKVRNEVICDKRVPDDNCKFTVRFPKFVWNEEGGKNDEGEFYLIAENGNYLRVKNSNDTSMLCADVPVENRDKDAALFTATIAPGAVISLAIDKQTLQHEPPHGELHFVPSSEASPTWAWFNVSYAQVSKRGLSDWE